MLDFLLSKYSYVSDSKTVKKVVKFSTTLANLLEQRVEKIAYRCSRTEIKNWQ